MNHFLLQTLTQHVRNASLFIAIACAPALQLSHAAEGLPQLGSDQEMSVSAEKQLGQRIAREIYRDPDYIDDPVISAYVQRIWQPLLAAARKRGDIGPEQDQLAWTVMTGKDRSINAFALPGGYFGLHLGLIGIVASRDELASVLAHELTHVSQRHIARQISKQNQQTPWLVGAMILGSIAASKNPQAASAVITGAQAASIQSQLNFSRDMEREADRIGFAVMAEAGFDVRGFTGMFDKLQTANRINDNGSFPYLRTHPLTTERLGDMQARLQLIAPPSALDDLAKKQHHALMAEHVIVATRARLLADASADKLRSEITQASAALRRPTPPDATLAQSLRQLGQLYGGALASAKQRDTAQALQFAQAARSLLASPAFEPLSLMQYAQAAIELIAIEAILAEPAPTPEQRTQAIAALAALTRLPGAESDRPTLIAQAQMARAGFAAQPASALADAIDDLKIWLSDHPQDALAWNALAGLYEQQGQMLRSLQASAESQVALLDLGAALDRLKAAQDWAQKNKVTHIEASILDTRTRALQAMARELALERDKQP